MKRPVELGRRAVLRCRLHSIEGLASLCTEEEMALARRVRPRSISRSDPPGTRARIRERPLFTALSHVPTELGCAQTSLRMPKHRSRR
eukprot:6699208-Prymnesium_polylepis.1